MAQNNFIHNDGDMVINCKATTAITAGQLVYAAGGSDEPFGTTVPAGVDYDEVPVSPVDAGTATQGALTVGIALADAASGGAVAIATEGIFLSPAEGGTNIVAGNTLRPAYNETTNGVAVSLGTGTTTKATNQKWLDQVIGRSITGAATEGHYILWKLRV